MTAENKLSAPKRRTRAEVQRLVAEFMSNGLRRSEFCQSRGLSFSILDRHLKRRRWKRRRRPTSSAAGWCRCSWRPLPALRPSAPPTSCELNSQLQFRRTSDGQTGVMRRHTLARIGHLGQRDVKPILPSKQAAGFISVSKLCFRHLPETRASHRRTEKRATQQK
jgi:hypothetical protein